MKKITINTIKDKDLHKRNQLEVCKWVIITNLREVREASTLPLDMWNKDHQENNPTNNISTLSSMIQIETAAIQPPKVAPMLKVTLNQLNVGNQQWINNLMPWWFMGRNILNKNQELREVNREQ